MASQSGIVLVADDIDGSAGAAGVASPVGGLPLVSTGSIRVGDATDIAASANRTRARGRSWIFLRARTSALPLPWGCTRDETNAQRRGPGTSRAHASDLRIQRARLARPEQLQPGPSRSLRRSGLSANEIPLPIRRQRIEPRDASSPKGRSDGSSSRSSTSFSMTASLRRHFVSCLVVACVEGGIPDTPSFRRARPALRPMRGYVTSATTPAAS